MIKQREKLFRVGFVFCSLKASRSAEISLNVADPGCAIAISNHTKCITGNLTLTRLVTGEKSVIQWAEVVSGFICNDSE